jgi:hypothetical protein
MMTSFVYAVHIVIIIIYLAGLIAPAEYMPYWIGFILLIGLGWLIFDDCVLSLIENGTWEKTDNFIGSILKDIGIHLTEPQADMFVVVGSLTFLGICIYRFKNIQS